MINTAIIVGRLVRDPDMKYLQSGTACTRITVAVDRGLSKDKQEEAKSKGWPTADFIPVTVWGKSAENCANYLSKGSQVAVSGRIQTGSYEKEGQKIYTTEVVANNVQFLGSKGDKQQSNNSGDFNTEGFHLDDSIDSEDIPF